MTDEEMAEAYAKLNARQYIRNDGIGFCTSEEEVKQAFLAGLKAGKDMNVATRWHDLRKDSKDLPKEDNWYQVSVYSQIEGKKKSGFYCDAEFGYKQGIEEVLSKLSHHERMYVKTLLKEGNK